MRNVLLPFEVFEEGDRVDTFNGRATVVRDLIVERAISQPPKYARQAPVVVRLDEPTSKYSEPGQEVHVERDTLLLVSGASHSDKPPRWNGRDIAFCTKCGKSLAQEEMSGDLDRCPNCKDQSYPCLWSEQVLVSINLHELRCLCIWAERWINVVKEEQTQASMASILRSIVDRLTPQLPKGSCLTLSDDIKALRAHGLDVETDLLDV